MTLVYSEEQLREQMQLLFEGSEQAKQMLTTVGVPEKLTPELFESYWALRLPAVAFVEEPDLPVALRVGGDPLLPEGMAWPTDSEGRDMVFSADLDVAEVSSALPMLPGGNLLFFQRVNSSIGVFETVGSCFYFPAGVNRVVTSTPEGLFDIDDGLRMPKLDDQQLPVEELALAALDAWSFPKPYSEIGQRLAPDQERQIAVEAIESICFELARSLPYDHGHLLGWAHGWQGSIEDEFDRKSAGESWRSLLSLKDDVGDGHWFIRNDDLQRRHFDAVEYVWDCS